MKLHVLKSEKGIYIANSQTNYSGRVNLDTFRYCYNGDKTKIKATFLDSWKFLEGVEALNSVQVKKPTAYINVRWELIDKDDNELNLPEVLTPSEVCEWWNDNDDVYDHVIGQDSKYYKFRTFYSRKRDIAPDEWEDVDFEVELLGNLSCAEVDNFTDMKIVVGKTSHNHRKPNSDIVQDLSKIATYSEIEKILVPDIAIHNRPCSIDADTTYKIIRNHVNDNIEGKYARVTSNYDFCFTVKKRIRVEPYTYKTEVKKGNGRSYARPRFNTHKVEFREVEIFEMCPSKPYQKYTPIIGFKGENLADLAENIKLYLDELMEVINAPVHECPHCDGRGSVVLKVEDINKR